MLQTAAVSAEALGVLPGSIERGLRERLLPPLELLSKKAASKARDLPQVGGDCYFLQVHHSGVRGLLCLSYTVNCWQQQTAGSTSNVG
jgi:hypothetical protein